MSELFVTVVRNDGTWTCRLSVELLATEEYDNVVEWLSETLRAAPENITGVIERAKWFEQRLKDTARVTLYRGREIEVSHVYKRGSVKVVHRA